MNGKTLGQEIASEWLDRWYVSQPFECNFADFLDEKFREEQFLERIKSIMEARRENNSK